MTELIHMRDNYAKEFEAEVVKVVEDGAVLNRTAFYPRGGGVDCDTGFLEVDGRRYEVKEVVWRDGEVVHVLNSMEGLREGIKVRGSIDWERRYKLMRLHTAAHLLEAVIYRKTKALIGSGRVSIGKSYLGFTLENMDKELILKAVEEANELIKKGARVKIYFMPREEALKDPEMVKLAGKLPPEVKELRIVEIEGIDKQACGGPHVADIREIGKIVAKKIENKGKKNRRLYYDVEP